MFLRGASGALAGIGSFVLTATLAWGADVVGPKAEGFKELTPSKTLSTDAKKRRDFEDQVRRIINGSTLTGSELVFDGYFTSYVFPQWTQTTEANLNTLPKERDKFVKNSLELSAKNPAAHARLIDLTLREQAKIAQDAEFHPAVRYNAILLVGLLNEVEPNRGSGVKQMPEPYVRALSTLTEELKKPGNNEAVRIGALLGVSRHLEWDNSKAPMSPAKMQAAVRDDIISELTNIVNTKLPPAGRSAEGQTWLRRRALEALGHAYALKVVPEFHTLLDGIISDDAEPISLRCTAAEVMSRMDYQLPVVVPVSPMAKKLGYLALYACHSELLRLEGLKKKDEEIFKMGGGVPGVVGGDGGGGGMPGAGGMMPGAGGAMPGAGGMMPGAGGAMPGAGGMMPGAGGMMPGMGGGAGRRGGAGGGGMFGGKDVTVDPKAYRIDYSKRRLRAELYTVQLALGPKKKDVGVKGLSVYATAEPDTKTLTEITKQVEDVIRTVEELDQSAEVFEKALRKDMKKLELLTKALPVVAKVDPAKADAAKGPAAPGEDDPMGAKPAAAKPAGEEPMEELPMGAPAKGPAPPAKGGPPADAGKAPPGAPADAGKGAAPPGAAPPAAGK